MFELRIHKSDIFAKLNATETSIIVKSYTLKIDISIELNANKTRISHKRRTCKNNISVEQNASEVGISDELNVIKVYVFRTVVSH